MNIYEARLQIKHRAIEMTKSNIRFKTLACEVETQIRKDADNEAYTLAEPLRVLLVTFDMCDEKIEIDGVECDFDEARNTILNVVKGILKERIVKKKHTTIVNNLSNISKNPEQANNMLIKRINEIEEKQNVRISPV